MDENTDDSIQVKVWTFASNLKFWLMRTVFQKQYTMQLNLKLTF